MPFHSKTIGAVTTAALAMRGINLKRSLATLTVAAGVLAAAGSASAGTHPSGLVAYNGHAGLGASAYQHNQTDLEFVAFSPQGPGSDGRVAGVTDGTSNTVMFGARAAAPILMADMGGQFF